MNRRIWAIPMSVCVAIATVTSALALEGLDEAAGEQQAPAVRVEIQSKTVTIVQAAEQEPPVRVLKTAPAPRRLARQRMAKGVVVRAVPAVPAVAAMRLVAPMAGNVDGQVRQYLMQFRPILRAEYHVVRAVCRLTPEQRTEIARAGEQTLRQAARKYVDMMRRPMTAAQRAALDPRTQIREGLSEAVKTRLSPDLAARLQQEFSRRAVGRKQLAVHNLVARLDRDLVLSPDQRTRIAESLSAHWDDSWCQSLEMFMHDYQFLPPIPDQYVAHLLNEPQKRIWRSAQKVGAYWGAFGMINGMMPDDPLEDDELRKARREAEEKDPSRPAERIDGGLMKLEIGGVRPAMDVAKEAVRGQAIRKTIRDERKAPAKPAAEVKKK